jgi:hypothetical protein
MQALWTRGVVAAIPTTWWGKTNQCLFSPVDARRISAYAAVRYGAFNSIWSVSGEYQYTFRDCGWTAADITSIGQTLQQHNPYRHAVSVHPSSSTTWAPPHNVQSSRPFHGQSWINHHWLQTGQTRDKLYNIVPRLEENRALQPAVPVFASEAFYERSEDPDSAYHARWQVWVAFLNGAAGFGYGAQGVWQFFDPNDPNGETGKNVNNPAPWWQAIELPGSSQIAPAKKLLGGLSWWKLQPSRNGMRIDGQPNTAPTAIDLSPPHAAIVQDQSILVIYIPRGNAQRALTTTLPSSGSPLMPRWFDPRSGEYAGETLSVSGTSEWTLPARPPPADEDWVLFVSPAP